MTLSISPASVSSDYVIDILRGNVPGSSEVSIVGHDSDLTTTRTTLAPTLTTGNIDQSGLISTSATVDVASTSADDDGGGSGLLTVLLQGLDDDGVAQSETIILDGQTEVTSSNTYSAVYGLRGLTAVGGNKNAGAIWAGNGTFTSGVPATKYFSMDAGFNKGLSAYYAVPAGKTLYLRAFTATIASSSKDVEFFIETSTDGVFWVTENAFGMESGGVFPGAPIRAVPGLAGGTHIRVEAKSTFSSTIASAVLGCQLVDD